ncbi:MAG: glycosyltransferase family protein [Methanoregula sp.]|nr:glycosyltransferase family protein [Methanoregula sp.]
MELSGKPLVWHVINRIKKCKTVQQIVVATSNRPEDRAIVDLAESAGVRSFAGSEDDVLDRYYQAATKFNADPVVRITADCPVIDPVIVDETITGFFKGHFDAYWLSGEFPDGLDVTVFSYSALRDAWNNAKLPSEREHVGPYIINHPEKFKLGQFKKFSNLGHMRWTVDEPEDIQFIRKIYTRLYKEKEIFLAEDILRLLEKEPDLVNINADILRNEGYLKSLKKDQELLKGE